MAFHSKTEWVLTDSSGEVVRRFSNLGGHKPIDLAISSDGTIVFTAKKEGARPLLYKWNGETAVLLSDNDGYHASPSFSPDGRQIVFTHHPSPQSGPVGTHAAGVNAQLWSIAVDGGAPKQLTTSPGCKGTPQFAQQGLIVLAHSTCEGRQGLEVLVASTTGWATEELLPAQGVASEPSLSSDGTRLAYGARYYDDTKIILATLSSARAGVTIAVVEGHPERLGLQWSPDASYLYFVSSNQLTRYDTRTDNTSIVSFSLFGESP